MRPIPQPHLLDPDRLLINDRGGFFADHEARATELDKALHETCSYAQQLWQTLDSARQYLTECLPPDPRGPDSMHAPLGAHPTGPEDDGGWNDWMATFAAVSSVMCGPHGDSGYGLKEAEQAATIRRDAPTVLLRRHHPELQQQPGSSAHTSPSGVSPATGIADAGGRSADRRSTSKTVGIALLVVLAVRGLLGPRSQRPTNA